MNHTTKPLKELTLQDIEIIRTFLPYDWRLQITKSWAGITTRQITETFYLRTRNPQWAEIVFSTIHRILHELGEKDLAEKCQARIQYCQATAIIAA